MSKGILEQLNDNIVELISLLKEKPSIVIDTKATPEKIKEAVEQAPKKVEVTPEAVEVEGGEVEVKEEPKAEETESTISDDELTKAVKEVAKKDKAHLVEIKKYITEKSVSKVTELAQADRQDFLDHLAGL